MTVSRRTAQGKPEVLIVGGGVAGIELAAALASLAPGSSRVTMIAPGQDFVYKPLAVEEPFGGSPTPRFELAPLLSELDAGLVRGSLERVDTAAREIHLAGAESLSYDVLAVCIGAKPTAAFEGAYTFWSHSTEMPVDEIINEARTSPGHTLTLVVPPGTSWPLPIYELALMFRRRAREREVSDLQIKLMTPEESPLAIFGQAPSAALAELLSAREIEVQTGAYVVDDDGIAEGSAIAVRPPGSGPVVALPILEGPAVEGLPADPHGFLPIDESCRVEGLDEVYAAGDGTSFPIKQGGLATQEADTAAEFIAAGLGADVDPTPFVPVLRGMLLTAGESLSMRHKIAGAGGEGSVSPESLWWPPEKISGRYLGPALTGSTERIDLDPELRALEVEVPWPGRWHPDPLLRTTRL